MNEQEPIYLSESRELWTAVRAAAEAGDDAKVRDLLAEMDLSPRLAKLFVVGVAEQAELAQVEKAGEGQGERFVALGEELALLGVNVPTKIEKLREQNQQIAQLRAARLAAERAVSAAKIAVRQKLWLENWLAELFGHPTLPHAGVLSALQPSPKVFDVAASLRLGGTIYGVNDNGWRKIAENNQQTETKRRRYQSFSPVAPRR